MGLGWRGRAHSAAAFPQHLADSGDPYTLHTYMHTYTQTDTVIQNHRVRADLDTRASTHKNIPHTYIHACTHIAMPKPHLGYPKS